ncbi:MAG: lipoprotein signal peptidase [Bacteroidia bacterium]|nr:lipoprotein signal peptidase [Bacteroidia bacterium]NNJ56784.1 lipoprotein signal peptidase [Bacteroidia bacterium]
MGDNTFNKKRTVYLVLLTVLTVLVFDQWLKIYIKTNMTLGQSVTIFSDWFELHFTENPGMAFGLTLGGKWGKIVLTLFRILASGLIVYYISSLIKEKAKTGLIVLVGLILAGALGNIIDSLFYGIVFSASSYHEVASAFPNDGGYAPIFMGKVVDMLYFPLIDSIWPTWVPFIGGERFQFFRPVFNIADAAISIGVFSIIVFRNTLFQTDLNSELDKSSTDSLNKIEAEITQTAPKDL